MIASETLLPELSELRSYIVYLTQPGCWDDELERYTEMVEAALRPLDGETAYYLASAQQYLALRRYVKHLDTAIQEGSRKGLRDFREESLDRIAPRARND